jgi:hypothetical protein
MWRRLIRRYAEEYGDLNKHFSFHTETTADTFKIAAGHPQVAIATVSVVGPDLKISILSNGDYYAWIVTDYRKGCELIVKAVSEYCISHNITDL